MGPVRVRTSGATRRRSSSSQRAQGDDRVAQTRRATVCASASRSRAAGSMRDKILVHCKSPNKVTALVRGGRGGGGGMRENEELPRRVGEGASRGECDGKKGHRETKGKETKV